jgi:hypothetical protein
VTFAQAKVRFSHAAVFAVLGAAIFLAFGAADARSATFLVDNPADTPVPASCAAGPADCTLRGAINKANAEAGDDVVELSAATYLIDTPLPEITERLTIDGNGSVIAGTGTYASGCTPDSWALKASAAALTRLALPIRGVCGRAVDSAPAAPTIAVGPRRADNTVSISGLAAPGSVELYRADGPAATGEATSTWADGVTSTGNFTYLPLSEPAAGERFAATVTDANGSTSTFSAPATTPADLTSPTLIRAVAVTNELVRLDFDESISPAVNGLTTAFSLSVGGATRQVTNVGVDGSSVIVMSVSMPWSTGETGSVTFTGAGRVTDLGGNELLGQPVMMVAAGPGELTSPQITKLRVSPAKFCQTKTRWCNRRLQSYIYFNLTKASRVIFTVRRASNRRFVVRYVRRIQAGWYKSRITGKVNGRRLPATNLTLDVRAEGVARNLSDEVSVPFRVVTRNRML